MKKIFALILFTSTVYGICFEPKGRVDIGPAYFNVRVLENDEPIDELDLWGGRADLTLVPFGWCGLAIRPTIYGGAKGDDDFLGVGGSIGHYTPINDRIVLLPAVGYIYSELGTTITLPTMLGPISGVKERFRSNSIFISTDVQLKISEKVYFTGIVQYAWAKSRTSLSHPLFPRQVFNGKSDGPGLAAVLDYYFRKNWSVSAAVGWNRSLDDARFGIEGFGVKLGLAYCFY